MALPGFTADMSVYKTVSAYRTETAHRINGGIYPAFRIGWHITTIETYPWQYAPWAFSFTSGVPTELDSAERIRVRACCADCWDYCYYKYNSKSDIIECVDLDCTAKCDPNRVFGGCA